jgi:alkanesulfonate monooxygenase SsuD/methylene tetrahydromethanopterin reductase-like flavin-dependent oxidoreductase (luciferase family)
VPVRLPDVPAQAAGPGAGNGKAAPFRLGFLSHLHGDAAPGRLYRDYVELFVAAEELGFDSAWVAQHHFDDSAGRLPSPFPFLAAVAERTRRIRLGTAVVTLPLEDPVRVAEDAAVLDALSGGRVELGVGSGTDPAVFAAFGKDVQTRREDNSAAVAVLRGAFAGEPVRGTGFRLRPEAGGLAGRVWQAAFSRAGARHVGAAGSRLLLNRATFGSPGRTDEVQLPWARAYRDAWPGPPGDIRIALSRGVYPAADRRAAKAAIEAPVRRMAERMIRAGRFPAGLSSEDYFDLMHISWGSPDEVAERLAGDRVLPLATDLIVQFSPAAPELGAAIAGLELLAGQVAPALGWRPAARPEPAAAGAAAGPIPQ